MYLPSPLLVLFLLPSALCSQIPLGAQVEPEWHTEDAAYQVYQSDISPAHRIRIRQQNDSLCDARTPQYTGWLDVGPAHLFFWYFESRHEPKETPLTLWLTGGPGGSSMLGMLGELGPCLMNEHGNATVHNEYGWNARSNLLFVDQPAGVGFSYLDEGNPVPGTSFAAASDMHLFLQLFVSQVFPELEKMPFHISGESYGGHYVPVLGSQILAQNALYPKRPAVNLQSVLIGNGYISPLDTAFGYWQTLCTTFPGVKEPVFNSTRCNFMAKHLSRCMDLGRICYAHPDPAICQAAEQVCWTGVIEPYDGESGKGGRNRFDITAPCEIDDVCYPIMNSIVKYLNLAHVWKALDIPREVKNFSAISDDVVYAFALTNDMGISTAPQVRYLLESGIDVLIYQGNLDLACNTAGNLKWAETFEWLGQSEFWSKRLRPWYLDGEKAGTFKMVDVQMREEHSKPTRFAFFTVDGAGHMVPQDKPKAALDMMVKWIEAKPFA